MSKSKTVNVKINNEIIMPKNINTYLGQKGYTILKKDLNPLEQDFIKEQLTVKPYTHGAPQTNITTFPAYRESGNKFYIPRYFGEEHFGPAKENKLTEGIDLENNIVFNGKLRDYQVPVVQKYIDHINLLKGGGGLLELPCAWGKCLGKDTPILMYDGTIKMVQNIKVDDLIMGDDSTPRRILSLARGREQMYKISNKNGDSYICNESHILSLKRKDGLIFDINVKNFLEMYKFQKYNLQGYKVPIKFPERNTEIEPYLLGLWIGSNCNNVHYNNICLRTSEILEYTKDIINDKELLIIKNPFLTNKYTYEIVSSFNKCIDSCFTEFLKKNNLILNKHIPHIYKCNSRENQLKLLAGIIDSNYYYYYSNKTNSYKITIKNEILTNDIVYLSRSLGYSCYVTKLDNITENIDGIYFKINIYGDKLEDIPILSDRKIHIQNKKYNDYHLRYDIIIEKLDEDYYYGFEIDGNKRFVLGDFTVTHNTSASLYILSQVKKKTLVIVHKEFLMNQWIERIQQFIPNARIGKIQGQVIDIDNKDIVLCMLQSLVLKDYPSTTFDSFGFTIIDEVHHISSQTFSNALFKVVTKYMLGLSATMNRKDGTTKVFKMFLGSVIHKVERKNEHNVEIRALTYKVNDDEFNETILDYKGQPQISSMISKLCSYNRRTEFIIKALTDYIRVEDEEEYNINNHKKQMDLNNPCCELCYKNDNYLVKNTCCDCVKYCLLCMENIEQCYKTNNIINIDEKTGKVKTTKQRPKCPNCKKVLAYEQNYIENPYVKSKELVQTIVLSHNLNVLEYIYKKFVCKNLASIGYYVGGMKEQELKKSEQKQVILASYQMASEGLDIPSLTTEFLVTPKTDVVQTIGRVLRAKHPITNPTIYDIVDSHEVFERQWLKRKAYYKKNNYRIIGMNSINYTVDTSSWKIIYEPTSICNNNKNDNKNLNDIEIIINESSDENETTSCNNKNLLQGKCFIKIKK